MSNSSQDQEMANEGVPLKQFDKSCDARAVPYSILHDVFDSNSLSRPGDTDADQARLFQLKLPSSIRIVSKCFDAEKY